MKEETWKMIYSLLFPSTLIDLFPAVEDGGGTFRPPWRLQRPAPSQSKVGCHLSFMTIPINMAESPPHDHHKDLHNQLFTGVWPHWYPGWRRVSQGAQQTPPLRPSHSKQDCRLHRQPGETKKLKKMLIHWSTYQSGDHQTFFDQITGSEFEDNLCESMCSKDYQLNSDHHCTKPWSLPDRAINIILNWGFTLIVNWSITLSFAPHRCRSSQSKD